MGWKLLLHNIPIAIPPCFDLANITSTVNTLENCFCKGRTGVHEVVVVLHVAPERFPSSNYQAYIQESPALFRTQHFDTERPKPMSHSTACATEGQQS